MTDNSRKYIDEFTENCWNSLKDVMELAEYSSIDIIAAKCAYDVAAKVHFWDARRSSGLPYIDHLRDVTENLILQALKVGGGKLPKRHDIATLSIALLHDTAEHLLKKMQCKTDEEWVQKKEEAVLQITEEYIQALDQNSIELHVLDENDIKEGLNAITPFPTQDWYESRKQIMSLRERNLERVMLVKMYDRLTNTKDTVGFPWIKILKELHKSSFAINFSKKYMTERETFSNRSISRLADLFVYSKMIGFKPIGYVRRMNQQRMWRRFSFENIWQTIHDLEDYMIPACSTVINGVEWVARNLSGDEQFLLLTELADTRREAKTYDRFDKITDNDAGSRLDGIMKFWIPYTKKELPLDELSLSLALMYTQAFSYQEVTKRLVHDPDFFIKGFDW